MNLCLTAQSHNILCYNIETPLEIIEALYARDSELAGTESGCLLDLVDCISSFYEQLQQPLPAP